MMGAYMYLDEDGEERCVDREELVEDCGCVCGDCGEPLHECDGDCIW